MAVIRRKRSEKFTIQPNEIWECERLSFEASALLSFLLTRPGNWKIRVDHLQKVTGYGRDKCYRLIRELVAAGYAVREQEKDPNGRFDNVDLVIYDQIQTTPPRPDNQETVPPPADLPLPDLPDTGLPDTVNQDPLIRTERSTRTESNKNKTRARGGALVLGSQLCLDDFEEWYRHYPHKVGKAAALKAFDKVVRTQGVSLGALIDAVQRYIQQKPPDRPYCNPSTWLNQERWKDQPAEPVTGGNNSRRYSGGTMARIMASRYHEMNHGDR